MSSISPENSQLLFDLSPEVFCILGQDGRIQEANPALERLLRSNGDKVEVLGRPLFEFLHPLDSEAMLAEWKRLASGGQIVDFEGRLQCVDGKERTLNWSAQTIPDRDVILVSGRDVTERVRFDKSVRRQNLLLQAIARVQGCIPTVAEPKPLFESLLSTLLSLTRSEFGFIGEVLYANDEPYLKTHAISRIAWDDESREFFDRHAPEGLEFRNLKTLFGSVLTTGQAVIANDPPNDSRSGGLPPGHPPLTAFLGLPFYRQSRLVGMVGLANSPIGYSVDDVVFLEPLLTSCAYIIDTFREAEARRLIEAQLRESEEEIRSILHAAPDAIISIDSSGRIRSINPAAELMFGYPGIKLAGLHVSQLMPGLTGEQLEELVAEGQNVRSATGADMGREYFARRSSGQQFPVEIRVSEVRHFDHSTYTGIVRDISSRKAVERQLAATTSRLESVLDAATQVSIIATDTRGLITVFNRGAELMLGYAAEEVIGRETPAIIHVEEEVTARSAQLTEELGREIAGFETFVAYAREGKFDQREWTYVRKDGSRFTVDLTVTAVHNADGDLIGFLGVAADVTERNAAQQAIIQAKEAAEQASQAKSDFLANISHEIRTPMNGILGMCELLESSPLSDEQTNYVRTLKTCGEALLEIINEVLDFSKIEAGRIELDPVPFSLRKFISESLQTLVYTAENKGIRLGWNVAEGIPDRLVGDFVRLRQILLNLVGNAVKFTSEGRVEVDVQCGEVDDRNVEIEIVVVDSGIGIPTAKQREIFEPFAQADSSTTRHYGGTGLGLSIVSRLVEAMQGTLSLESVVGEGTTFRIRLSFERDQEEFVAPDAERFSAGACESEAIRHEPQGLRLLVAEDNPINQYYVRHLLEAAGHRVALAHNGQQAVELFQKESFDLILMDVQMPVMDGFQAVAAIRELEKSVGRHTPIVALTAHAGRDYELRCREHGFDEYVAKPFRAQTLNTIMAQLLPREAGVVAESREPVSVESLPDVDLDLAAIVQNADGDPALVIEMASLFVSNSETFIRELVDSHAEGDAERLNRAAHTLKSPLGFFAETRLLELASELEKRALKEKMSSLATSVRTLVNQLQSLRSRLVILQERGM